MSWPKPVIILESEPKPPKFRRWFIALCVILAISILLIFLFKSEQPTTEEINSYLAILAIEASVLGLLLSFRILNYGWKSEYFESWEKEKQLMDLCWNDWASQHLVVLSHYIVLPEALSIKSFLAQSEETMVNTNQAISLDFIQNVQAENRQRQAISEILSAQFTALLAIPLTQHIHIEILSVHNHSDLIKEDFHAVWEQLGLPHSIYLSVRQLSDLSVIDQWIDSQSNQIKLVIILQLEDVDNNTALSASEFVSSLILVEEQLAKKLALVPVALLLRPMISDEKNVPDDIAQMHEIQLEMKNANHLWITGFEGKYESNIAAYLAELKLDLGQAKQKNGIHRIDLYQGLPGKFNGWLALSLAISAIELTGETQLTASHIDHQITFNLVYPAR